MQLLVINWFDWTHPLWGGAEVYLHEIYRRLAARGHEVTLLCSSYAGGAPDEVLDGVQIMRRGHFWTFHLEAPWIYRRELAHRPWDGVFEYTNKVPMLTPLFVKAPLIAVAHHLWGGSIFHESRPPVAAYIYAMERLLPLVYRRTPWVAVSESTRRDLVQLGLPAGHISVIPNGIEGLSPDGGAEVTLDSARSEPLVAWIGRMRRYKRVDVLLRAWPLVCQVVPGARLELAGDGPDASRLQALSRQLGLTTELVRFLGTVSEAEKAALLGRAKVLAQPSMKEGWGRTVLEAALHGVPAVASDVPGLQESVRHGETGLLVPPGDPVALAAALSTLLQEPSRRTAYALAARQQALRYNWQASADATEHLARHLADTRGTLATATMSVTRNGSPAPAIRLNQ